MTSSTLSRIILANAASMIAFALIIASAPLFAQTDIGVSKTIQPPLHTPVPGGIAVLKLPNNLTASETPPTAYYQNTQVMLLPPTATQTNHWLAIVGIPLTTAPGTHQLNIRSGEKTRYSLPFTIVDKTYQEQRITLTNKRQVNPLTNDLQRIRREKNIMVAAFKDWSTSLGPSMKLTQPAIGPISSPFGLRRFFNDQPRKPHSGLDIAAPEGTPIQAPAEAIVIATGDYFFNGKTVLLNHGHGLITMYCHMSRIDVSKGALVQRNDTLGLIGKTGRATGPHLHWSVSLNNARIDPNLLMTKTPPHTPLKQSIDQ
jgi:murein DD-endopeptidase MepM/ murein hydrolase activator NlpD